MELVSVIVVSSCGVVTDMEVVGIVVGIRTFSKMCAKATYKIVAIIQYGIQHRGDTWVQPQKEKIKDCLEDVKKKTIIICGIKSPD